jgi:hypothetical protein
VVARPRQALPRRSVGGRWCRGRVTRVRGDAIELAGRRGAHGPPMDDIMYTARAYGCPRYVRCCLRTNASSGDGCSRLRRPPPLHCFKCMATDTARRHAQKIDTTTMHATREDRSKMNVQGVILIHHSEYNRNCARVPVDRIYLMPYQANYAPFVAILLQSSNQ